MNPANGEPLNMKKPCEWGRKLYLDLQKAGIYPGKAGVSLADRKKKEHQKIDS